MNRSWFAKRVVAWLALVVACQAFGYVAIVNKTDNTEIHVVPAARNVVIDGDLTDWDLSGAIDMFLEEASRAAYSLRVAMTYDARALYVGGQIKDPTPMRNDHTTGGDVNMAWNADAVQIRFVSNPDVCSTASLQTGARMSADDQKFVNHITLWYSTRQKKACFHVARTLRFKEPEVNPAGVEGAYAEIDDPAALGYTFEYRIPWTVLRAPRPLKGGDKAQIQFQVHWGNDAGTAVKCGMTDVRNPDSGDLGYMGPSSWGTAIFHDEGNLKLVSKDTGDGRAEGHIPITFTLKSRSKVSLALYDAQGSLVRTCLGAAAYEAGNHTYRWDGLSDYDKPLPAGTYTYRILTHGGIRQDVVCDVGVSGNPPWQTEDGTGGWAGDYGFPRYVSTHGNRVVLGTGHNEAAPASACLDLEGRKLYGCGGSKGPLEIADTYGYYVDLNKGTLTRFSLKDGVQSPWPSGKAETPVVSRLKDETKEEWVRRHWPLKAIAVLENSIVVSGQDAGLLYLLNRTSGKVEKTVPIDRPFGLATDDKGTLYAVSGNAVGRYDLNRKRFVPIIGDLDEPRNLACDRDGNLYVALQGKTMQVWKLSPKGSVLSRYGKAGGRPALGAFETGGMLKPHDIDVDIHGRLWVAEADGAPKRYSVWNPNDTLYKQFFGSQAYSCGAIVDPARPEFVYISSVYARPEGLVRYQVDYESGTWSVVGVVWREYSENGIDFPCPGGHMGGRIFHIADREFLWSGKLLLEQVRGKYLPRLFLTSASSFWIDDNNNGHVEDGEKRGTAVGRITYWGNKMDAGLNIYFQEEGKSWAAQGGAKTTAPYAISRWDFLGFNDQGGLRYGDPAKKTIVAYDSDGGAFSSCHVDAERNVYALVSGGTLQRGTRAQGSGHRVVKFAPDGRKLWEYHNVHCAFAWTSDPYTPGALVGAVLFSRGGTREMISVTGYYGQYFLLDKKHGLFVDALGEEQRGPYTMGPHMVLTENFNGTLYTNAKNGHTYFIGGDADARVWELQGLDAMKRASGTLTVSTAAFAHSQQNAQRATRALAERKGRAEATVARVSAKRVKIDGNAKDWLNVSELVIVQGHDRSASVRLGHDNSNLYLCFQVSDDSPLRNRCSDYRLLFKTGDAVELQMGTNLSKRNVKGQNQQTMAVGDLRLLMTRDHGGKMRATILRPVLAEPLKPDRHVYESPVWKQSFDEVKAVTNLAIACADTRNGYVVEAAIPWSLLGVEPGSKLEVAADVGVIFGNKGGTRNAIRYMWSDKSPEVSINNDIPSEARLHPNDWGRWVLR